MMRGGSIRRGSITSGAWQWTRDGEPIASLRYVARVPAVCPDDWEFGYLRLIYSVGDRNYDYRVDLMPTPCRFGGMRWWFRCPSTGRRVLTLFKFSGMETFVSRQAIRPRPTYASQRLSGMGKYQHSRQRLRDRLGQGWSHDDDLVKPPRMHRGTFARYLARDSRLAEQEDTAFTRHLGNLMARLGVESFQEI